MLIDMLKAALIGGILCAIAQILIDKTALTPARILVVYVISGVILGAVGLYSSIVKFAGVGATLPLTGFGYIVSEGVRRAIDEKGFLGIFTGSLTAAAGGTGAALVFGSLAALIFRSKRKE